MVRPALTTPAGIPAAIPCTAAAVEIEARNCYLHVAFNPGRLIQPAAE
jgi:hypothetical protein